MTAQRMTAQRMAAQRTRSPRVVPPQITIGTVTHYYDKIKVAVLKLKIPLTVGTTLLFAGENSSFKQKITSMQIDRAPVESAAKRQEVGIKVKKAVAVGAVAYQA